MKKRTHRRGRRPAATAAMLLISAAALAGCQSASSSDGPVTVRFAVETGFGKTSPYAQIIDGFNKSNTQNIKVELTEIPTDSYFQTVRTMFQAGNAPDVVWGSPGTGAANALGVFAQAGQLVDLSKEQWASASVPDSAHDLYYVDGKLIGVPVDVAPIPQVVNATAYKSLHLDFAKTYDQLLQQCAAVRKAGRTSLLGLAGSQPTNTGLMGLELAASRVYAKDPDWNQKRASGQVTFAGSQEWRDTLQAVVDLHKQGCFQGGAEGGTPETVTPEFTKGKILGIFAPASIATDLGSLAPTSQISVAVFPGTTERDTFLFASPSNALSINASSKHVDAAKALLEYWMQPQQLDKFAALSGNVSLTSVLHGRPVSKKYAGLATYLTDPARNAPLPSLFWPNPDIYNKLGVGIQGLLTGQAEVDKVLQDMDAAWQS
ncbi:raffinose/stachyose/melibiose transport system substrate-binding protein [Kribbella sp. VKM Ac-2527]|uniref:Raffinose/stachyose/melibiose transport system substrate-binding protein n=1 Tax=Kribbella caucasensis TaxID=2512215 RepID=A0A4R6KFV5_9ACTN|nr:ABC transporter substrate-binding protein [Kribbella sp. VKM Ac-2527]TDO47127.1 raffinose/stachyose/melibiose transport system substrate-binding protein [Kribbella sp. VKM Ac-2527]